MISKGAISVSAAMLAMTSTAHAQSAPRTMLPRTVSPSAIQMQAQAPGRENPGGAAGRAEAMISALQQQITAMQQQIDTLSARSASQQKTIDYLTEQRKTLALENYTRKGEIMALRQDFSHHTHYAYFMSQLNDHQVGQWRPSTLPTQYCHQKPAGAAGDPYSCAAPE